MKKLVLAILLASFVGQANAQTWVICESMVNGARAVFQGRCPNGWYFVDYA